MDGKSIVKKARDWFKEHQLVVIYPVFAIIIEMAAVFSVEKTPFFTSPFLIIAFLTICVGGLLLLNNNRWRLFVGLGLLTFHAILDLIFAVIYDMTGQYFSFEMLNLRNDAVAILEEIPVNFITFYVGLFCCVAYGVYGSRYILQTKKISVSFSKKSTLYRVGVICLGVISLGASFFRYFPTSSNKYNEMITGKAESVYSSYGMVGNLLGELGNVIRGDDTQMTEKEIESYIYNENAVSKQSPYFGISKDKNVIVMLSESFEWYAFRNGEKYPNALPFTDEQLAALYPNLTKFYNESVVMNNFHSKEKTDISETLSVLGSYPTGKYISYDYHLNAMPQTLPNVLKITQNQDIQMRSYHNGDTEFYNRNVTHGSFGFEEYTAREGMTELAEQQGKEDVFTDWKERENEYNLDSEMIELCKDEMFPTDRRFFTYITTITMHGVYDDRVTLKEEKEAVAAMLGRDMTEEEDVVRLFNYMVTAKEFDDAVGVMMSDLEKKNLLDDTVILLFGDHEAYYNEMSKKVKDIEDYKTERKFTDLYNVPLMIYDTDLVKEVQKTEPENRIIEKFVCTSDIMPTLMDLLGIRYYSNMYYGVSVFLEEQSVLYSRAYNFFMTDGIVGRSIEGLLYRHPEVTDSQHEEYEKQAVKLVEKIQYCDELFQQDYFANENHMKTYIEKIEKLNA